MVDADCLSFADAALASVAQALGSCKPRRLEFSIRLAPGRIEDRGRICCWLLTGEAQAGAGARRLLRTWDAPAEVIRQARADRIAAHGLAVGAGKAPDFRYYRHSRAAATQADLYHAWRWRPGGGCARAEYSFHFAPETPGGDRPENFVPAVLRPAIAALADDDRIRSASGFWLRRDEAGSVDQVDIAMPGNRRLGELLGLTGLDALLRLPAGPLGRWRDLPVRHLAAGRDGDVTAYASADLDEDWPANEQALQRRVMAGAEAARAAAERLHASLPSPPPPQAGEPGPDLDAFYGGDLALWRAVLGPGMHYHAGLFDAAAGRAPDDAEMDAALERAVRCLYPFLPAGGRVYDIGCGWGGPLAMINRELGCRGLGLTISRTQFRHVEGRGLPVRLGDAERLLPPGRFDGVLMLESFCHVRDKARLLERLRPFAGRLVMRVNCQDRSPRETAFAGSMHMVSSGGLRAIVEGAGWRIAHWRDRRAEALPSILGWQRRLARIGPTGDIHLETLRAWCARVAAMLDQWGANNPLIELVAE